MTIQIHQIQQLREQLKPLRANKTIALVPTMGNLHEGHLSLVKQAQTSADIVVVSIFVNPTQFGIGEDFDSYPRTLAADVDQLAGIGTDYVFAPSVEQMYPDYPQLPVTSIGLGEMTGHLCGQSRPTHFDGVGLIVSKLFNIIQPDMAVFGKKDYQQLALIRQITDELSYPIRIIGADIVRAADGLALSSRNQYLTQTERQIAPQLNRVITELATELSCGKHLQAGFESLINQSTDKLNQLGFKTDYLEIRTRQLQTATETDKALVILVAAWLGKARLLDNIEVTVNSDI